MGLFDDYDHDQRINKNIATTSVKNIELRSKQITTTTLIH